MSMTMKLTPKTWLVVLVVALAAWTGIFTVYETANTVTAILFDWPRWMQILHLGCLCINSGIFMLIVIPLLRKVLHARSEQRLIETCAKIADRNEVEKMN